MAQKSRLSKRVIEQNLIYLVYILASILILLLSIFNMQEKHQNNNIVLGAQAESKDDKFWQEITNDNPTYIDAWLELGRMDKVLEIDPNY